MPLFRRKSARVVRRGAAIEDRTVRQVGDESVTIRRFPEPEPEQAEPEASRKPNQTKQARKPKKKSDSRDQRGGGSRNGQQRGRSGRNQAQRTERRRAYRPHLEVVPPPDTARKQMLVRTNPHQTQIVVLEGPVLVEHYVARSDQKSLVGNV